MMDREFADHADFYARGPYSGFLQERRFAGSKQVAAFRAEQPAGHYPDPAFANALLYLSLQGAREAAFDWGAGRWRGRWRSGDLTLVPPDSCADVTLSDRHAFLAICLPEHRSGGALPCGSLFAAPFRDALTAELCRAIWTEADHPAGRGRLFVDHALDCLLARLGSIGRKSRAQSGRPTLPARVMRDLADFVEAHCDRDLAVSDLARIAGYRVSRFNELFHNTTGKSPYRYVTTVRLDRARRMLCTSPEMTISEIAIVCGFSSQSHLTDAYRKAFSETPGRTRALAMGAD